MYFYDFLGEKANIEPNEKLPVLFWIHGGAFIGGSGNDGLYGPDFLIEKRVILVTSNYRLGVLGFLSLDLPEYSGNMGLKDVQLALKWTHKNIERFGGDRNRITIFGHSAGIAIHLRLLSMEMNENFTQTLYDFVHVNKFRCCTHPLPSSIVRITEILSKRNNHERMYGKSLGIIQ